MARGPAKPKEQKPIEQTLWDAANKLRGKVEPAEYKHVVLSMIFLKYANDRFDEHRAQMIADGQQAFLEMMKKGERHYNLSLSSRTAGVGQSDWIRCSLCFFNAFIVSLQSHRPAR